MCVDRRPASRAALAAAVRADEQIFRHQPVAVRARLFVEQDGPTVRAVRVRGQHVAPALKAAQCPGRAAGQAGCVQRADGRAALRAEVLSTFGADIITLPNGSPAGRAAGGCGCLHAAYCNTSAAGLNRIAADRPGAR